MNAFRRIGTSTVSPHSCATACCFLGYAPDAFAEDPAFQEMLARLPDVPAGEASVELWCPVSEWVLGGEYWAVAGDPSSEFPANDAVWQFLFNGAWPDDPEFAARRALKVLVDLPEGADIREEGWHTMAT